MDTQTVYELIGYAASLLILISLMMRSVLRLRLINLVGAVVFTVYGLLIDAPPVWLVNAAIALIDLYYLRQMLAAREEKYELLEVDPASAYLRLFLAHHDDDISRYQPDAEVTDEHRAFLILQGAAPVGAIAARMQEGVAAIELDYVTQDHRDLKPGRFLFEAGALEEALAAQRFVSDPGTPAHARYLTKVGFEPAGDGYERRAG